MLERNMQVIALPGGGSVYVWRKNRRMRFSARVTDERGKTVCEWKERFERVEDAIAWAQGEREDA